MLFSNVFSDMFDDMFSAPVAGARKSVVAQPVMGCDIHEYSDHYELFMDLAGFKKENIKAELKDGYLTIKAERTANSDQSGAESRVIRSERFVGTCQRTFYVGDHVRREDVSAAFEDGVLKLSIPKKVERPQVEENHFIAIE